MALQVAALNTAANAIRTAITAVSLHSADPGGAGTSELSGGSYARKTPAYSAAANGQADLSGNLVFDIPAGVSVSHYGLWAGATFYGGAALSATETYGGAGTYTLTAASIDVNAV